jgi:hypothetical protein
MASSMIGATKEDNQSMEERVLGEEKPFWVILSPLEHFISGHDSLAEAEAEAQRLNDHARRQARPPHYTTKPRPQTED